MSNKRKREAHEGDDAAQKEDTSRTTIIASALPISLTSERLSEIFSAVGPIRSAFVAKSKEDAAKNQGYGFIRFVMPEDAKQALAELHDSMQEGQKIRVAWARRRHRQEMDEQQVEQDVQKERPKWVQAKDLQKTRAAAFESSPDASRTVLVRGLERSEGASGDDELMKALYKRAKKLVAKSIGRGDISVNWPLELEGEAVAHIVTPNPRTAQILASQLNNHIFKAQLLFCCQQFEREAVTRKGRARGGARLIVRNLAWDVTAADLSAVFAAYGPLHSVDIPRKADAPDRARGFAFVWMLRKPDAEKAIAGINGSEIAPGYAADRVVEGADNRKKSEKRKAVDKSSKAGGRAVAVDWALGRDQWKAANIEVKKESDEAVSAKQEDDDSEMVDIYGRAPGEESDGYLSEELSESDSEESSSLTSSDESIAGDHALSEEEDAMGIQAKEEENDTKPDKKAKGKATANGMTLFIRNIQFEATEDELFAVFKRFGPVQYARVVNDAKTGRSRGTGFVHFYQASDAERVLKEADDMHSNAGATAASNPFSQPSILQFDPSSSSARSLSLHGRVLSVSKALSRDEAESVRETRDKANAKQDRRNLYLLREGVIVPNTPLANSLHRSDLEARTSSLEARRALIRTNPSLFISRTRLSIRQLPLFVNDRLLNKLARFALKAYDNDMKAGKQPALTTDELDEQVRDVLGAPPGPKAVKAGKPPPSRVQQAKVIRQDDRVDPLTGEGRSKGYGFLQLGSHADALRILRWANANRSVHAILRGWWRDELSSRLATMDKEAEGTEKDVRKQRLQARISELEQESNRAEAKAFAKASAPSANEARTTRTLIVELSIENAVTVKRREESAKRSRELAKRKQATSTLEEPDTKPFASKKRKLTAAAPDGSQKIKAEKETILTQKSNGLGGVIGRKRVLRRLKRAGKS